MLLPSLDVVAVYEDLSSKSETKSLSLLSGDFYDKHLKVPNKAYKFTQLCSLRHAHEFTQTRLFTTSIWIHSNQALYDKHIWIHLTRPFPTSMWIHSTRLFPTSIWIHPTRLSFTALRRIQHSNKHCNTNKSQNNTV